MNVQQGRNNKQRNLKMSKQKKQKHTGENTRSLWGDAEDRSSGDKKHTRFQEDIRQALRQRTNKDKGKHRGLYTHREGRGNWTQVEHMRTGADNHKDRKWRKKTHRNRAYKIKQETEHRENMWHRNNTYTNINTRIYMKHEVIIKQKTHLIRKRTNKHT